MVIPVVVRNLASLTAMRVLSAAFAVALVAYLARVRGPEELGAFSLLLSIFLLTQQLPLLGLHLLLERDAAAHPERLGRRIPNALVISVTAAALIAAAVGAGGQLAYPDDATLRAALWLVGLAVVPAAFTNIADAVLLGQQRMHVLARIFAVENLARTITALAAVALGYGLATVFALFLAARVLAVFVYLRDRRIGALVLAGPPRRADVAALLAQAPVFLGIVVLALLMTRLDMLVLAHFSSMTEVGHYAAPFKVYEVALMVPSMITLVLYPVMAGLFAAAPGRFSGTVELVLRGGLAIAVPAALALAFAAQDVMALLFGPSYTDGTQVLQVLAACLVLVWTHQVLSGALLAARRQRADLAGSALACAVYVPALVFFASRHGAIGAALATALMWAVQVALRVVLLRQAPFAGRSLAGIAKIALGGGVAVLIALSLHGVLGYGALLLALAAYGAVAIGTRTVSAADWRDLERTLLSRTAA